MSKVSCVSGGKAPQVPLRMARAELLLCKLEEKRTWRYRGFSFFADAQTTAANSASMTSIEAE